MHVVGHEHIGVDGQPMLAGRALETIQEDEVIGLGAKDRVAVVAALDNVQRLIWSEEAGKAGHREGGPLGTDRPSKGYQLNRV